MLGLPVVTQTLVRRERWPAGQFMTCTPLVYAGQDVAPDQPLMRLERGLPQAVGNIPPGYVPQQKAEIIPAGLRGRVVEITPRGGLVIESRVARLRGVLGIGGQTAGILTMWSQTTITQEPPAIPSGAILVVPGPVDLALLRRALASGVVGIVTGSIPLPDLEGFYNIDIIDLLNSPRIEAVQSLLPPLTVLLTVGPGRFSMHARTIELLSSRRGTIALLSGTTLPSKHRAPELLISLSPEEVLDDQQPVQPDLAIVPGAQVRVSSGDHEGAVGIIDYLFSYEQTFTSGVRARAVRLRLEDSSTLVVPLALIERVD